MGKPAAIRKLGDNQANAILRSIRISPRKLGLVAGLIRGMDASNALVQLTFSKRRIAGTVKQCLQSAIANAENNHNLNVDRLYVSEVLVGKALVMKRFRARARGRAAKIIKPFSNISITVSEREEF
jgi:large subunit ribosomal protein L22